MATPPKRIRRYSYNQEFEHLYMVVNVDGVGVCLLCNDGTRFTCPRVDNIKRHYKKKHAGYNTEYPLKSAKRLEQIRLRKAAAGLKNCVSGNTANLDTFTANRVAFFTAYDIAKNKEPFANSEIFAKRLHGIFDMMYKGCEKRQEILDFVDSISLSRQSITRKIGLLSANIRHQFLRTLNECSGFSIQLDGLTDIKSVEQVTVFFRIVFPDCSVKEHLFACIPLHGHIDAEAIYNVLKAELVKTKVPLEKLVSITTDGVATMVECKDGLITRLQGDPDFPQFTAFHCLLHQLSLAAKKLADVGVVEDVGRMINSKGLMVDRFYQHLTGPRTFLESRGEDCIEPTNIDWLMKFTYLTDITEMINTTNKDMQGGMKFIGEYFASLDRLKAYMESAIDCLKSNEVPHLFPRLITMVEGLDIPNFDGRPMFDHTKHFLDALTERLKDYSDVRAIVNYSKNPFDKSVRSFELIPIIAKLHPVDKCRLQYEIEDLRLDDQLKTSSEAGNDIWRIMDATTYPNLNMVYKRTLSYFGTSYLCDSAFLSLKQIKSTLRTRMTDEHLQDVLHISTSTYEPDFDELARGWREHKLEEK